MISIHFSPVGVRADGRSNAPAGTHLSARWLAGSLLAVALAVSVVRPSLADTIPVAASAPPAFQSECSACHLAYPPALLPAASWQRLMANLPRHFGTDASLDAATAAQLSAWLQANAASYKKVRRDPAPPPEDRITRSSWFVREHHELGADLWRRASIRSASNCVACHANGAQGRFSEHDVQIPN
jgi:hypothetical protein